jgi:hypothetical protein
MAYCEHSGCMNKAENNIRYIGENTKVCPDHAKESEEGQAAYMHDHYGLKYNPEAEVKVSKL